MADLRSRTPASAPSDTKPSGTPPPRGIRKVLPIPPLPSLTPHENIYTVPNLLTASRIVAAPFIGYAILHDAHAWALGLFVYAGVSDLLDGWIARRWNLHTVVGSIIDPMADKLLMTILTVCLATKGLLPGKCLSVFTSSRPGVKLLSPVLVHLVAEFPQWFRVACWLRDWVAKRGGR